MKKSKKSFFFRFLPRRSRKSVHLYSLCEFGLCNECEYFSSCNDTPVQLDPDLQQPCTDCSLCPSRYECSLSDFLDDDGYSIDQGFYQYEASHDYLRKEDLL